MKDSLGNWRVSVSEAFIMVLRLALLLSSQKRPDGTSTDIILAPVRLILRMISAAPPEGGLVSPVPKMASMITSSRLIDGKRSGSASVKGEMPALAKRSAFILNSLLWEEPVSTINTLTL